MDIQTKSKPLYSLVMCCFHFSQVNLLSTIMHENLVPLLGYCSENDQQILVYPFMSNGSLQDRLYGIILMKNTKFSVL